MEESGSEPTKPTRIPYIYVDRPDMYAIDTMRAEMEMTPEERAAL